MIDVRAWMKPEPPQQPKPVLDSTERRAVITEIAIVLLTTFALSGISSILSLVESALQPGGIAGQSVALNGSRSVFSLIDLLYQLLSILKLGVWAGLGLYLLWRAGLGPRSIGLGGTQKRRNALYGVGLAALIGLPGLGLYLIAQALGFNLTVVPTTINDHWWRVPALILFAVANAAAEEVIVVAYLISRLRRLGWSENRSLLASAVLRGSYHLYQGLGGGLGNLIMGLVFGRVWQRTNRLWPLIIAHAIIDTVAFVGYALLRDHLSWLP